jgi:uncharacterized RDD family membrane protein YckC
VKRGPDDAGESLLGHYAGAVTRLGAFALDFVLSLAIFNLGAATVVWALRLFTPLDITDRSGIWWFVPLTVWEFVYFWYCLTLAGRTPGKALFGLRVVRGDGSDLGSKHAAIRVLVFPLSSILAIGFLGIVFGRHRRALHDVIADTAVVYDFDARSARLRFLVRQPIAPPRA